jgi:8-oxo-dGTP pyrophosphatase MutT (NUDIX family)
MADTKLRPWVTTEVDRVFRGRIFEVERRQSHSPRLDAVHSFDVIRSVDWVNVIPLTAEGEVVMIRQFRHGIAGFTLEIPGGMVDPGEAPIAAARREMREESGYDTDDVRPLGTIHPNPAILDNRCHSFVAHGARSVGECSFDGTEECEVELVPLARIPDRIRDGTITHALVVVAFHWLALREREGSAAVSR